MTEVDVTIKAIIFTIIVPGTVVVFIPWLLSSFWYTQIELGILRIFGILLISIGLVFYGYSVLSFLIIGKGTPMIFFMKKVEKIFGLEPDKLVQSGLYQYSRNPMYLGVVILIFGEGLLFQLPILLILGVVSFILFHLVVCFVEEPHLKRKHKEEYENYLGNTHRWIGFRKLDRK
ncbi:MAG: methyltransferase family protein [Candidatus Hodarchaeales archaeon]|jgi:protein-S-isoprenylcysteine O-methyltransferase Ste14